MCQDKPESPNLVPTGSTQNQNTDDPSQKAAFKFPFQRRTRSNSPPKDQINDVILQKIENMSPRNNMNNFGYGT